MVGAFVAEATPLLCKLAAAEDADPSSPQPATVTSDKINPPANTERKPRTTIVITTPGTTPPV